MKFLITTAAAALALGALTGAAAADDSACGKITIANMSWASAEVMGEIDRFILEHGFGCDAELVPGDTMPTFTSMTEKGEPDVAPEMFVNQFREQIDAAVKDGRIEYAAKVLSDGSQEGFWIPQYIADEHPDIQKLSDAFAHPELFPAPEDPSKGAVYDCPAGWGCQIMVRNFFKAYDGEKNGFVMVDTGSSAGLDGSIANAFESKKGWLGYYWSPTAIIGRYPMKLLEFDVPFDQQEWKTCTTQPDCENPKKNAWTPADVYTLITPRLAKESPKVAEYLKNRSWGNDTVNSILAWKDENQATGEDTALQFLETHEDIWSKWVSPEVAEKVKAAL
ncbi:ABC transporter substrate-binding protein [Consotaella salsifontis]|uniref:Glycine betaine/proline transport system substrate-binding protein n=1 Tax=Consotaella salsifontis TaxID=1365950 RepID=A0A1T4N1J6_9HYPH|nr:ABC transporter substrate-binding protein [Consotaella salsifontis]SJZ73173.1 glycine betaine/proline transport system substrate-binding protein [Consotaella salsifontis]